MVTEDHGAKKSLVKWAAISTVLLDMDGTLLDLKFDNTLWNDLLPTRYSKLHNISLVDAKARLYQRMRSVHGKIDFYCLDQWQAFTHMDIIGLHAELAHLIDYRPGARFFWHTCNAENFARYWSPTRTAPAYK